MYRSAVGSYVRLCIFFVEWVDRVWAIERLERRESLGDFSQKVCVYI